MRWRRRHRPRPARPADHHGGPRARILTLGPPVTPSGSDQTLRLLPAGTGGGTPWPSRTWRPILVLASCSGIWASSARTPGGPPSGSDSSPINASPRDTRPVSRPDQPASAAASQPRATGSDADLIRAAQADPAEFAAVYERYVDPIYRYCVTRVGSPADAEDATSQTFARAFGALSTFRSRPDLAGGGVRSWLFTIAHNVVVSGYRDRRPTSPLADADLLIDPDPTPDEQAIAAERREILLGSIARLSDDQRRVVELRLAGLSGPEIAAVLGRSHGAIKMMQFRAIDRLRTLLADRLGAEPTTEVSDDQR